MKIKVPQRIKFLTHTYTIRCDDKELASVQCAGLTRHLYQEIIVDKACNPKSELDQILLHEFIHVIERHMGMKLDDMDVERISEGLTSLLFDNFGIELDWSNIKSQ